jgi:hypothetical protein
MKKLLSVCLAVLAVSALGVIGYAAAAKDYSGVWKGTWEGGGGNGTFELTLENNDGVMGGKVSVTGEPTYQATLRKVTFVGAQMSATYDFPPDERAEVALTASFAAEPVKGNWMVRGKDGSPAVMSGSFTVRKAKKN